MFAAMSCHCRFKASRTSGSDTTQKRSPDALSTRRRPIRGTVDGWKDHRVIRSVWLRLDADAAFDIVRTYVETGIEDGVEVSLLWLCATGGD